MTAGILPNVSFISQNRAVNSAKSARFRTGRSRNNQIKSRRKGGNKSAVARVKDVRQLGCVFQDTEPLEALPNERKSTKILESIRRVQFIKASQRHANIRENRGPSLIKIQVKLTQQRNPYALNFENRSQEETERQERCARGDAWRLAKNIYNLKERQSYILFTFR